MSPVAFATGLIWPALSVIAHRARWRLPGALTAASLVLVTAGMVANRTGDGQPHPDSIFYVLDGDRHRAMWASLDSAPDVWTRQFLGASAVRAPLPPLLRPFIPGGVRDLKLRLNSVRGANTLLVYLDHAGLVESASIDGVALQPSGRLRGRADDMGAGALRRFASQGRWGLVYYAPERDLELTLHLRDGGGLRLYAADKSDGLPEALDIFGPRPAWLMPSPDPLGLIGRTRDAVIVAKSYYLPSGPGPQAGAR
jgi:hypothetical protein